MDKQGIPKLKRAAAALAAVFILIVLASAVFEALHADHDCCGEGCSVCAQLTVCDDLLASGAVPAAAVFAAVCAAAAAASVIRIKGSHRQDTLFSLKVMLLD